MKQTVTVYHCSGTVEALRYVIWTQPDYSDVQLVKLPINELTTGDNLKRKLVDKIGQVLKTKNFVVKDQTIYSIITFPNDVAIRISSLITEDNALVKESMTIRGIS